MYILEQSAIHYSWTSKTQGKVLANAAFGFIQTSISSIKSHLRKDFWMSFEQGFLDAEYIPWSSLRSTTRGRRRTRRATRCATPPGSPHPEKETCRGKEHIHEFAEGKRTYVEIKRGKESGERKIDR
jgi:hypothetical protein